MNPFKPPRILFFWFVCFAISHPASAQTPDGTLDPTFGEGGKVIIPLSPGYDSGYGVALQPDGKIVVAGESQIGATGANQDVALIRLNPDGSLDNTFGSGGIVITSLGPSYDLVGSVVLQPDGKIVVAGQSFGGQTFDFIAIRYNANGSLDNSFGGGGVARISVGDSQDSGWFCALQPDGKILVVGPVNNGVNQDFGIVRLNTDGSLDNTFGSNGKVITPVNNGDDYSWSCAFQTDGKILVGGRSFVTATFEDFAVVRYNADGTLDPSFGNGGKVTTPVGQDADQGRIVAVQADGKIVLGGRSTIAANYDFALLRYNADGGLDSTFGGDGIVTTPVGTGEDMLWAVAFQTDGRILAAGYGISAASGFDFALVRYNPDGSLDNSFGSNGIILTPVGTSSDFGIAMALQTDGKIVVAGASVTNTGYDFAVARYANSPPVSASFPIRMPESYVLYDSYPNPFNPTTNIRFEIPRFEHVTLTMYDLLGRKVAELVNENLGPGNYERTFDADGLASGVYLYRLQAGSFDQTKKVVLIK